MARSPERRPRMPDVGGFLARALRAAASVLEGRRTGQSVSDDPLEAEMARLRRRYPDAPEHWLRFVAERMPAPTTADELRGDEAGARRPADRGASPPTKRSGRGRVPLFGRRRIEAWEETAATRPDAAAEQNPDDGGDASSSSSRIGSTGRTVEPGTYLPERPPLQPNASKVSFVGPRFRPEPAAEQPPTAPIPAPATNHRRFVARFVSSDSAPRFDSRGCTTMPDETSVRRLGLRSELPMTRRPTTKPSVADGKRHILRLRRTSGESTFAAPTADGRNDADISHNTASLHTASEKRLDGQRGRFGQLAAPRNVESARDAVVAPDEPKWPELPESSWISPDSERVPSARVSSVPEEWDRWNGLPF